MKLIAAAIAAAALGLPAAQASTPGTVPGLVYTPGYGNSILARYDPLSPGPATACSPWSRHPSARS